MSVWVNVAYLLIPPPLQRLEVYTNRFKRMYCSFKQSFVRFYRRLFLTPCIVFRNAELF